MTVDPALSLACGAFSRLATFKVTVKLGRPAFSEFSCYSAALAGLLTRALPLTLACAANGAPIALTTSLTNYHSYHYVNMGIRRRSINPVLPSSSNPASKSPSNEPTKESSPSSKRGLTLKSIRESRVASRRLTKIVINQRAPSSPASTPSTGPASSSTFCSTPPTFESGRKSYLRPTKASLLKTPAKLKNSP